MAVGEFQTIRKWLKKLPWGAKPRLPCERALKAGSEAAVKRDFAFYLGSLIMENKQCKALIVFDGTDCQKARTLNEYNGITYSL